jgi:acyl-coenzyme A synthetase/AMP-(fatty) acid ligase
LTSFPETILEKVKESNCKWIFCDEEKAESLLECVSKVAWPVEVIVCGPSGSKGFNNFNEFYKDDGEACPTFTLKGDDIACIFPTSGTTGSSKGIYLLMIPLNDK